VFVHGGAWISSSKSQFAFMGEALAQRGIPTVVAGYRLSPKLPDVHAGRHPMHLMDVAQAVEWTAQSAAAHLGFVPQRIFLVGHSAGAQLTGLLALQKRWLSEPTRCLIKGVVGIEGIYSIPDLAATYPAYVDWFLVRAFSSDRRVWRQASPMHAAMGTGFNTQAGFTYVLVQSREDELVNVEQTTDYERVLRGHGGGWNVSVRLERGGLHDAILRDSWLHDVIA
ncbi:Alpha/Beta hydrolase protein, partial [Entophlyctis helioformis]